MRLLGSQACDLAPALERVLAGHVLRAEEAECALEGLTGPAPAAQKAALLAALRTRGERPAELVGLARGLLARARGPLVARPVPLVDTCGTGGDGTGSLNVSTATALLVAALGIPVAKHGNRSVSSRCGSADVLEACGLALARAPGEADHALCEHGFAFLFAPAFHPTLAVLAPLRRELGVRTVLNLLGPLVNPAPLTHQLVGAATPEVARLLAGALAALGRRALVVHGDGFDEATPCGPFVRLAVTSAGVHESLVDPRDYGCAPAVPTDLAGGDATVNARRMERLLEGHDEGPFRDAVCLNAALVLQLVGREPEARRAFAAAREALEDGRAHRLLARLRNAEARP